MSQGKRAKTSKPKGPFKVLSYSIKEITFVRGTNLPREQWEVHSRPASKKEQALIRANFKDMFKESALLHRASHKFSDKFYDHKKRQWKLSGYKFMEAVRKYAKRNKDIDVFWCDDNHHASSNIVLIHHQTPDQYWGTTVLVISQFGNPPVDFFLYPGHTEGLLRGGPRRDRERPRLGLLDILKTVKAKEKRNRKAKKPSAIDRFKLNKPL